MNELKDQICSSWFAPVGSASDYPLLSKWVIYGEVTCVSLFNFYFTRYFILDVFEGLLIMFMLFQLFFQLSGGSSDEISPIYSLWATLIGLYMANYVVERSTG